MIGVPESFRQSFSATDLNLLVLRVEDLVCRSISPTRDQLYRRSLHPLPIQKDSGFQSASLHRSTYGLQPFTTIYMPSPA